MTLKDVLAKVAKGEALTDDEKDFVAKFDLDKATNDAAKAARKSAEAEAAKLKADLAEKEKALASAEEEKGKGSSEYAKLSKKLDEFQKKYEASEAKLAAKAREESISAIAESNGCKAAKGISSSTFKLLIENSLNGIDLTDNDAVKAAIGKFKAENAALIDAGGTGGASVGGKPHAASQRPAINPYLATKNAPPNLTEQFKLEASDPAMAKTLKAEADAVQQQQAAGGEQK